MLRLIVAYRWELWLLVGVPAVAWITRVLLIALADGGLVLGNSNAASHIPNIGAALSVVLLLALSYPRVRGLGRDFLALLWGYRIAAAALSVVVQSAALWTGFVYPRDESLALSISAQFLVYIAFLPIDAFILLLFARKASRISLPHAFFIVAFALFAASPIERASTSETLALALSLTVVPVAGLLLALVKVWLLGDFDRRSAAFRRNAIGATVAATLASGWAQSVIPMLPSDGLTAGSAAFIGQVWTELALLLVYFALVYFLRVRQPAPEPGSA